MSETRTIEPLPAFDAEVTPPGSKSLTNRALVMAAMAHGTSTLRGVLFADDTRHMIGALQSLGFTLHIDEDEKEVVVHGRGGIVPNDEATLHLGNSGTSIRFLTSMLCQDDGEWTLDGIERMRQRPIAELVDPLRRLGAEIEYLGEDGMPPIMVLGGGLQGARMRIRSTLSSQYISSMLMAAPLSGGNSEFILAKPVPSIPYITMTMKLMAEFGGVTQVKEAEGELALRVKAEHYQATDYAIEPDASNASYFLAAAAAVSGARTVLPKLGHQSLQGDAEFCDVLGLMGCDVDQHLYRTDVRRSGDQPLRGIDVDLNRMPDMAQTLAALAVLAEGPTTIRNVGNLRVKETDRLEALRVELTKLGAEVQLIEDDITIFPPENGLSCSAENPVEIDTYDDHRMAMAFSVIGSAVPGIVIRDPACVNKTYPGFFDDLESLRAAAVAV